MTPDRWNRVKDVLDEALDRPAGKEREAFLDKACAGDEDLRVEVESLLAGSDGEVSRFLSEGIPQAERADPCSGAGRRSRTMLASGRTVSTGCSGAAGWEPSIAPSAPTGSTSVRWP